MRKECDSDRKTRLHDLENLEEAGSVSELALGSINVTWGRFYKELKPCTENILAVSQRWVWKWLYRDTGKLVTRRAN